MKKLQIALAALDRLARLGNEPRIGNSHGNVIAYRAAEEIRSLIPPVVLSRETAMHLLNLLRGSAEADAIRKLEEALKVEKQE